METGFGKDEHTITKSFLPMQLCTGKILRNVVLCLALLSVFIASLIWYFCTGDICSVGKFPWLHSDRRRLTLAKWKSDKDYLDKLDLLDKYSDAKSKRTDAENDYSKLSAGQFDFNIKAFDVIVFLHIQNTGGSVFARHMIEDLALERPCTCKRNRRFCRCYRPNRYGSTWLFSRYTMGWKCGVHPDWTELTGCVDRVMDEEEGRPIKRRYFFITLLRDPVKRFLSEFWHTRKGQSWRSSRHWCSGSEVLELPSCFNNEDLEDLSLEDFLACPHNLAINRQTRMLSDLALVGCYNSSAMSKEERNLVMLTSAKNNLHKMAFFGLSEFPKVSQYMFETTFVMNFLEKEPQPKVNNPGRSARKELFEGLTSREIEKIKEYNHLDMELYHYAKELLFYRFERLKNMDPEFEDNFKTVTKNKFSTEDWADREDFIDIPLK